MDSYRRDGDGSIKEWNNGLECWNTAFITLCNNARAIRPFLIFQNHLLNIPLWGIMVM